jgi:acyl-coenzyme A thioesterase PaaI-like protein
VTIDLVRNSGVSLKDFGAVLELVEKGKVVIIACSHDALPQYQEGWHDIIVHSLVDTAAQWAALTIMPDGVEILDPIAHPLVTYETPMNMDKIIATGRVIKIYAAKIDTEATLTDESGNVIAKMQMNVLLSTRLDESEPCEL